MNPIDATELLIISPQYLQHQVECILSTLLFSLIGVIDCKLGLIIPRQHLRPRLIWVLAGIDTGDKINCTMNYQYCPCLCEHCRLQFLCRGHDLLCADVSVVSSDRVCVYIRIHEPKPPNFRFCRAPLLAMRSTHPVRRQTTIALYKGVSSCRCIANACIMQSMIAEQHIGNRQIPDIFPVTHDWPRSSALDLHNFTATQGVTQRYVEAPWPNQWADILVLSSDWVRVNIRIHEPNNIPIFSQLHMPGPGIVQSICSILRKLRLIRPLNTLSPISTFPSLQFPFETSF